MAIDLPKPARVAVDYGDLIRNITPAGLQMADIIFPALQQRRPSDRTKRPLSRNVSIYLDLLRLVAAFAVFLGHANSFFFPGTHYMPFILGHQREAVAVFFVLSGFVIRFVVIEKEGDWTKYLIARLARIYSVAILAVFLTLIVDTLGIHYNSSYYNSALFYAPASIGSALKYLSFTKSNLVHAYYIRNGRGLLVAWL